VFSGLFFWVFFGLSEVFVVVCSVRLMQCLGFLRIIRCEHDYSHACMSEICRSDALWNGMHC
jgi:hypothetical protein